MRRNTRRALRLTSTIAGVAALGAAFAGTASASPLVNDGDSQGHDGSYGYHEGSYGSDGRGSDSNESDGGYGGSGFGKYDEQGYESEPELAKDNFDGETMSPGFHNGLMSFDTPTVKTT